MLMFEIDDLSPSNLPFLQQNKFIDFVILGLSMERFGYLIVFVNVLMVSRQL